MEIVLTWLLNTDERGCEALRGRNTCNERRKRLGLSYSDNEEETKEGVGIRQQ